MLEYAKRTGSIRRGLKLQNQCSCCHLKGHNKANHCSELDDFLKAAGILNGANDANALTECFD